MDLNGAQWELRFLNFILFVFSWLPSNN
jgi:hypothetical protein